MIPIEEIAQRLNAKPTRHKKQEWTACCPAHEDKSPSLHLKLATNGNILIHCFAGCSIADICAAIGLDLSDLFPEAIRYVPKSERNKAYVSGDAMLEILYREATIIHAAASAMYHGEELSDLDMAIISTAREKIADVYFYVKSLK